jgi:hypothetical protein
MSGIEPIRRRVTSWAHKAGMTTFNLECGHTLRARAHKIPTHVVCVACEEKR